VLDVFADIGVEIGERVFLHAGLRMPPIAHSLSHLAVTTGGPLAAGRENLARRLFSDDPSSNVTSSRMFWRRPIRLRCAR
jgi:hypothetical protein